MEKRNFFEELMQGFDELKREREGNRTLRNQEVAMLPLTTIPAPEIIAIQELK